MKAAEEILPFRSDGKSIQPPWVVVDLDGTLVKTDLLLESLVALLKQSPYLLVWLPLWLWKGKAYLKEQVARRVSIDVNFLPYREDLLDYLKEKRAEGRPIALATGSNIKVARQIANHIKLFDRVYASDGTTNLCAELKRDRLVSEFGEKGFDYVANDWHDLVVWASARRAIVVHPSPLIASRVAAVSQIECTFKCPKKSVADYLAALRPQHWVKNLLVFVPVLAAHHFEVALLGKSFLAFAAFACFASAGYLLNDLLDLPADRHHPRKRYRPFASGDLSLSYALRMIPALFGFGCLIGLLVSPMLLAVGLAYFGLSVTYSVYIKKIVLLDVIVLASLYTIRIIAGSASVSIWPSPWLLAVSAFLFFSLALMKRFEELTENHVNARGYEVSDLSMLASMGIASGYVAILVLALYINTATAHILYERFEVLWFLCPLLLYWVSHLWLSAHRGKMPDDPIVFATNDRTSRVLLLLMFVTALAAL